MVIQLNELASSSLKPTDQSKLKMTQQPKNLTPIELHVNHAVASTSNATEPIAIKSGFKKPIQTAFHVNHAVASTSDAMAVATAPVVKPIAIKSGFKKPNDAMGKKEVQMIEEKNKPQVYLFNGDGKPVCSLCQKIFGSMEKIYNHLTGHSDGDWIAFFSSTPNVVDKRGDNRKREAEVIDLEKCLPIWNVKKGKRTRLGFRSAADVGKSSKDYLGLMELDNEEPDQEQIEAAKTLMLMANVSSKRRKVDDYIELEAADCLVLVSKGDPTDAVLSTSVQESRDTIEGGCKMVHNFDLNEEPPMEL